MKKMLFSAASLLVLLGSCSQNELEENVLSKGQHVVTATIEGQTNSRLNVKYDETANKFSLSWSEGDSFKVFGDDEAVYGWTAGEEFTLSSGTNPANPKYAVYPYIETEAPSISGTTVTMTLSATPAIGNINLPMWATPSTTGEATEYSFRHLAAALRFTLNDIPSGYNKLIVEASNPISGQFTANLSGNAPVLESTSTGDDNANKVTVSFSATDNDNDKVFYIPLPVGEYESLKVSVADDNSSIELKSWEGLNVVRGKMYYTTATVNASSIDDVNEALRNVGEVATTVNLTEEITAGTEALVIPAEAKDVTLNFKKAPITADETPLLINQNETVSSGDATSILNITMPSEASGLYAKIVAPTTTVTLTNGTYESLEATTATNTLVIEEGVTINNLVVNGGNVVLKGNVVNFKSAGTTTITLGSDINLTQPWQFANGSNVVLDLNGHCITSAENYAATLTTLLAVHNGAKLTIEDNSEEKNGSIDTKNGGTKNTSAAILLTTRPTYNENLTAELEVNGGTLKGDYYAISGNGGRKNTKVTINGGLLSSYDQTVGCGIFHPQVGEITIKGGTVEAYLTAIEMRGGTLVVEDGTLTATCKDATKSQANGSGATIYGAAIGVSQHSTNNDLSVTIKGGTLTGSSALYEEDTCDDDVDGISLSVTGGTFNGKVYSENCSDFIHGGTFNHASAFKYLAEKASIVLGGEITLEEPITIAAGKDVTLDLNGQKISMVDDVAATGNRTMLTNKGILMIEDNSVSKAGVLDYKYTAGDGVDYALNTITNLGTLILKNGKILNSSTTTDSNNFAIDSQSTSSETSVKIEGGTVECSTFRSIRMFANSETNGNSVYIGNGEIKGQVWLQSPNDKNNKASLVIKNGSFEPKGRDGSSVYITKASSNAVDVTISGGTFKTKIGSDALTGFITGGTFTAVAKENTNVALLAEGYSFVDNTDGTYSVQKNSDE